MWTIDSFEDYTNPIDEVINEMLLPTLFGQTEPLPKELSGIMTMPPAPGGLGMPTLKDESPQQYAASKIITASHIESIIIQSTTIPTAAEDVKKLQQSLKAESLRLKSEEIYASLPPDLLRQVTQARDKEASS